MKKIILLGALIFISSLARASYLMIPMDQSQKNHLKAYGLAYWVLENEIEVDWLLNYRGGSFMFKYYQKFENELIVRGISYEVISDAQSNNIVSTISSPSSNMDVMKLEKFPKIAVYTPKSKQPW
ncbi:MAG: asparagine synthetase B, partial [Bacteroidota bacterium]|nr:asparagine synthetase B [Bacteroidota bacterium]